MACLAHTVCGCLTELLCVLHQVQEAEAVCATYWYEHRSAAQRLVTAQPK